MTNKTITDKQAREPYKPKPVEEQITMEEVLQHLDELRCIYLGSRRSMALGLAIKKLKQKEANGFAIDGVTYQAYPNGWKKGGSK